MSLKSTKTRSGATSSGGKSQAEIRPKKEIVKKLNVVEEEEAHMVKRLNEANDLVERFKKKVVEEAKKCSHK